MAKIDVIMPQMGESIAEGTLSRWIKKVGDAVKRDEPIFEIVFQPGENGEREITVPLDLAARQNKLRLMCALYGPSPSTAAELILTDDGRSVLTGHFETDRDVETIDQTWTIQRAGVAP